MLSASIAAVLLGLSLSSCGGSPLSLSKINALKQKEEPSSHQQGDTVAASQDELESNIKHYEESVSLKSAKLNADLRRLETSLSEKLGNLEQELALKQKEEKMLRDRIKENVENGGLEYPVPEEWLKDKMPHLFIY